MRLHPDGQRKLFLSGPLLVFMQIYWFLFRSSGAPQHCSRVCFLLLEGKWGIRPQGLLLLSPTKGSDRSENNGEKTNSLAGEMEAYLEFSLDFFIWVLVLSLVFLFRLHLRFVTAAHWRSYITAFTNRSPGCPSAFCKGIQTRCRLAVPVVSVGDCDFWGLGTTALPKKSTSGCKHREDQEKEEEGRAE